MKYTLPVLALLGLVSVEAININADIGMGEMTDLSELAAVDAMSEANRYFGSDGKPIILAETQGHARLVLEQVRKNAQPMQSLSETEKHPKEKSHAETNDNKTCTGKESEGHEFHCPINDG